MPQRYHRPLVKLVALNLDEMLESKTSGTVSIRNLRHATDLDRPSPS